MILTTGRSYLILKYQLKNGEMKTSCYVINIS